MPFHAVLTTVVALLGPVTSPLPGGSAAVHEVPASVAVQMYVAPVSDASGSYLDVLIRIPLEAARDMDWPLVGPGYLVLDALDSRLRDAAQLWIADELEFFEDDRPLGAETIRRVRLSLPGDRSYRSWPAARGHVMEFDPVSPGHGLPPGTRIVPEQALLDAWLRIPVENPRARFSLEPSLAHLGVETVSVIHFITPDGAERPFQYRGNPGRIRLDPSPLQAVLHFVGEGIRHILGGLDHLLFLLVLVLPFRSIRAVIPVVTAFTVAHSITLVAAALGLTPAVAWFPALVETLIAASIVWMAVENLLGTGLGRRWQLAFAFGLIHGFGFSFVLADTLQFAGRHLVVALLAFNLGVELGQVALVALSIPILGFLLQRVPRQPAILILTGLGAHEAWHWMTRRGAELLAYEWTLPDPGPALLPALLPWALVTAVSVAAAWGLAEIFRRWTGAGPALAAAPVSPTKG